MYGGEESDEELVQLVDVSEEEEELGKDIGEFEGSWVAKTEKLCSRVERGKEGGDVTSDSLSKVMISLRWTWSGCKSIKQRKESQ